MLAIRACWPRRRAVPPYRPPAMESGFFAYYKALPYGQRRARVPPMNVIADTAKVVVDGIGIDVIERGRGAPLLFLHPDHGIDRTAPVLELLAGGARLLAPSHPGFGRSEIA